MKPLFSAFLLLMICSNTLFSQDQVPIEARRVLGSYSFYVQGRPVRPPKMLYMMSRNPEALDLMSKARTKNLD